MPKKFIFLHEARARADSERIYGNPGKIRDAYLKKKSRFLGKIFNLGISRPNKGKTIKANGKFTRADLKK